MIRAVGIMTGNSLDAVDTVITEFDGNKMIDICGFSQDIPKEMADSFRELKSLIKDNDGFIEKAIINFDFKSLHSQYITLISDTVKKLIKKSNLKNEDIDIVGFHGQTVYHLPPSIANGEISSTIQIGSGQILADLLNIPVVFDFRSDDIFNGGEGAPLAPVHNQHIAKDLRSKGIFPVAFCNAGNTGNIAVISEKDDKEIVMGWDVGPFNHFIDLMMREEKNLPFDKDGAYGKKGKVNPELLQAMFEKCVTNKSGENFLLQSPPKSSDPAWYQEILEMKDPKLSFVDRLRTTEFFSAYIFAYSLNHLPKDIKAPQTFLVFGGGWKNPLVMDDFQKIIKEKIPNATIDWSGKYGYSGQYMEARIFADMAKCKLMNEPFSYPSTTGCKSPTVCGIIVKPGEGNSLLWSRAAKKI